MINLKSIVARRRSAAGKALDATVERFLSDSQAPVLVSFPRTGSHWLRMMMELYFERPCLTRPFFYGDSDRFLAYHTHDLDLDVERESVIYLYRDPIDTIYSQLRYHNQPIDSAEHRSHWANLYGSHLDKWLVKEKFTSKKAVVRYESLRHNLCSEFRKVANHFGSPLSEERLSDIALDISKRKVKEKTGHDPKVVQLSSEYEESKTCFRIQYGDEIWRTVLEHRMYLRNFLVPESDSAIDRSLARD